MSPLIDIATPPAADQPTPGIRPNLERYAAEFREQGFTVLEGVLDSAQIEAAKGNLDEIFAAEAEIGAERGWHNETLKVAYMLPIKSAFFRCLCFGPEVLELMRLLLGERFVLGSLNGLSMAPGGKDQPLHIDQWESVPGEVLTVNAMHLLDEFTLENGATRVVPGSQQRRWRHDCDPAEFEAETVRLVAPAGSLVAFNGALWHAGSKNTTSAPRRVLHPYFHKHWVMPQWDFTRSFPPGIVDQLTPEESQLFGFKTRPRWYDSATDRGVR